MYHWGVVRALVEEDLLPVVLCGSSIGALVVAILGDIGKRVQVH